MPPSRRGLLTDGPSAANAHAPDEYVSITSTPEAAQVMAATILRCCGVRGD